MAPFSSPTFDQSFCLVEVLEAVFPDNVGLALVPDGSLNLELDDRSNHAVVHAAR